MATIKKECLMGLDLGTSMIKGVLLGLDGQLLACEKMAMEYITGKSTCEFDADQFYTKVTTLIRQLLATTSSELSVLGVSMASASGNTTLISGVNEPLAPAISWLDDRVDNEVTTVFGNLSGQEVHERVGWPLLRSFPLAHLAWLKVHRADLLRTASKICLSTDYILYRLTDEWGIDSSTATTFYLQDQVNQKWYEPFLSALDIPLQKLPGLYQSGTVLGTIAGRAAAETGLPKGTPVVLGAFDHPCAARGSGVLQQGQVLLSSGTSWVLYYPETNRDKIIGLQMLCDPFLQYDGLWGAMKSIPAVSRKINDQLGRDISKGNDRNYLFSRLAKTAPVGSGGLFIDLDHLDESSCFDAYPKEYIARALMEGTAYLLKRNMNTLEPSGFQASNIVMVGGPTTSEIWPEIVCDILGCPLSIVNGVNAGAIGAAILAGCGIGLFPDEREAFRLLGFAEKLLYPNKEIAQEYEFLYHEFCLQRAKM